MHTTPIRQRIADSADLRILHQDNLAVYADINHRAFRGEGIADVPVVQYLRIIKEVQDSLAPGENDTLRQMPAKKILDTMLGRTSSYKNAAWIGTDHRGGQEVVVLLPAGGRVLKILAELETDHSLLAQTGLDALTKEMALVVARLSGDAQHQIAALQEQRDALDARIQHLQDQGARPMTAREKAQEMQTLTGRINTIKSGFAQIPAARRAINTQNQDTFLGIDDDEDGKPFDTVMARERAWDASSEHAMLENLRTIHTSHAGRQLQHNLEIIASQHQDLLTKEQRVDVSRFLADMARIAVDIDAEILSIIKAARAYVEHPDYRSMRQDAWAMREAMATISTLCETWQPTPRDKRLEDIGLDITLPFAPHGVHETCSMALNSTPPNPTRPKPISLPEAPPIDPEEVQRAQAERARKAVWLQDDAILGRIRDTMAQQGHTRLSAVLHRHPPRYGRQEISRYLAVAAAKAPSRLDAGDSFRMRLTEKGHTLHAEIIDPVFLTTGQPGQGFDQAMTLVAWLDGDALRALPIDRIDIVATT